MSKLSIIVEGMDGTGKSTLIKHLAHRYGLTIVESGGPPKDLPDLINWCRLQYAHIKLGGVIMDRVSSISQPCYNDDIDSWTIDFLVDQMYHLLGFKHTRLIYCRPPTDVILSLENHEIKSRDSKELIDYIENNADKILDKYDSTMERLALMGMSYSEYDYTDKESMVCLLESLDYFY